MSLTDLIANGNVILYRETSFLVLRYSAYRKYLLMQVAVLM